MNINKIKMNGFLLVKCLINFILNLEHYYSTKFCTCSAANDLIVIILLEDQSVLFRSVHSKMIVDKVLEDKHATGCGMQHII